MAIVSLQTLNHDIEQEFSLKRYSKRAAVVLIRRRYTKEYMEQYSKTETHAELGMIIDVPELLIDLQKLYPALHIEFGKKR